MHSRSLRFRFAIVAAFTAAACTSADRNATPAGEIGGTLIIALPAEPQTLMPPLVRNANEKVIADQIFDVLAEIGPDLNTYGDSGWTPKLAESWQWSADSLSIAFRLNPRARWHDGPGVTSKDIRFSLDLYKDPKVLARAAGVLADVDSVSTPDSLTAVVWYAKRSPEQFYNIAYNLLIVPEHLLRDADRATLGDHPFARNPVGSGPFRFVRWDARSVFEVKADTSYYLGRPLLNRVIWLLSLNPTNALEPVLAGEADMFELVTTDGMARIARQDMVKAVTYSSPNYVYLGFNARDPKNPERPHPLLGDRQLRRALTMAIDRRVLLKNALDSLGFVGAGPFSRVLSSADTTLAMVPFDSAGADRLLDSLGWRDHDSDGIREKSGRPLRFGIIFPTSSVQRRRYAELIQAQLRPHGVQVDVDGGDFSVFGARLFAGQFDALLNNWTTDPSPSSLRDTWYSVSIANRRSNYLLYSNLAVDAYIDSAMKEPDATRSRAHYRAAYQRIIDDAPAVWLYEGRPFMAINGRVKPVFKGSDVWWRQLRLWSIPAAGRLPRDG